MPSECSNIVFFGHHKCGSRFFRLGIMAPLAKANGYEVVGYKVEHAPFHFRIAHDLDMQNIPFESLNGKKSIMLNLSNAGRPVVERINELKEFPYRGVHVIRDPRQVLVSNYFHHKNGHNLESAGWVWDQLKENRPILNELPLEDGLLYELSHISRDILENQLFAWQANENILEIKLENFDTQPTYCISHIMEFLGLKVLPMIRYETRNANPESVSWREIFTDRVTKIFKDLYGGDLIRLGYEMDTKW